MEGKTYWLISAPKTREDTFLTLNKKTADEHDFSVNYKFNVPDLKVFRRNTFIENDLGGDLRYSYGIE